MYSGKEIVIEGEKYILPPISLGQLRNGMIAKFTEHDKLAADGKLWEFTALRGEIILAALRRNYPDFPEDKLMGFLDVSNISPLWLHILGVSGLLPGETPAAIVTEPGTLNPSTDLSPQPTDGPTSR